MILFSMLATSNLLILSHHFVCFSSHVDEIVFDGNPGCTLDTGHIYKPDPMPNFLGIFSLMSRIQNLGLF